MMLDARCSMLDARCSMLDACIFFHINFSSLLSVARKNDGKKILSCVMNCTTDAPLLETSFTAIVAAGSIMCVMFIIFMAGCNLAMRKMHQLALPMSFAWLFALVLLVWFWIGFSLGFTPEYIKSRYLPANATLTNTTERAYPCTELHNCMCTQSFDRPCAVVQGDLLNASGSAPCAGDSCCARRIYRCTRTVSRCSKSKCTTYCAFGFYECIVPVSASRCTAIGGTCRKATAEYEFTTRCNQTVHVRFEVTCKINQPNCVQDFMDSMPVERVIYYAPWDPAKYTTRYVEPKGQVVNIVLPMLGLLALLCAQLVIIVSVLMHYCRSTAVASSAPTSASASASAATSVV